MSLINDLLEIGENINEENSKRRIRSKNVMKVEEEKVTSPRIKSVDL